MNEGNMTDGANRIAWDDLSARHGALVDATSIYYLGRGMASEYLSTVEGAKMLGELLQRKHLLAPGDLLKDALDEHLTALSVLENSVLFDALICDEASLRSLQHHELNFFHSGGANKIINYTSVPSALYEITEARIGRLLSLGEVSNHDLAELGREMHPGEKPLQDEIFERSKREVCDIRYPTWRKVFTKDKNASDLAPEEIEIVEKVSQEMRGTNNNLRISGAAPIARSVFYSEIAAASGLPLVLHQSKYEGVKALSALLNQVAISAPGAAQELVRETLQHMDAIKNLPKPQLPPLTHLILQTSKRDGLSVYDATLALRDSKEATRCRNWLSDLQTHLNSDSPGGIARANKLMGDLEKEAKTWRSIAGKGLPKGVTFTRLNLAEIPVIGWLLKLIEAGELRVPDIKLSRSAHTFLFEPYRE